MSDLKIGDKVGIWHVHQCHACGSDFHLSRTSEKVIKSENDFFCEECVVIMEMEAKDARIAELEGYEKFYKENRIALLQYESLRKNFNKMTIEVLGEGWYSMSHDVYGADADVCEAITKRASRTILQRLLAKGGE